MRGRRVVQEFFFDSVLAYSLNYGNVTAVQKAELPWRFATNLTGMSRSACRSGRDLDLGATESGHPVPNSPPASSSLLLVSTSPIEP